MAWLVGGLLLATPHAARAQGDAPPSPSLATRAAARSLLVPGWGQTVLGQRRGLAYALAETAFWALWAERRHKGGKLRTAYRDLAWREARSRGSASRVDPAWAFFETLSKWTRSGAFDGNPTEGGIQPEQDPSTFNGSIWRLAVDLYFTLGAEPVPGTPAYEAALAWYENHAYAADFLWDWSGKDAELAEYKDLIHRSDRRFSQATAALGAVLANHLLSATDAFVSARVPGDARLRVIPPSPGANRTGLLVTWNPAW